MTILTAQQMKQAEKTASEQGLSYLRMMDNAGSFAAGWIYKQFSEVQTGHTIVLCGNGNNGGDGFVVARRLAQKGCNVTVVLANGAPLSENAVEMYSYLKDCGIPVIDAETQLALAKTTMYESDFFVDGVFGTGFHGELPTTVKDVFVCVKQMKKPVVALDLPSGVVADTGVIAKHTLRCKATVSFHALKFAHVTYPAREYCGGVHVADIGIPKTEESTSFLVEEKDVKSWLNRPVDNTHKGTFGTATLFVGSEGMAGAATFAVVACLRCGVGLAKPVIGKEIYPLVAQAAPEGVYQVYSSQHSAAKVAELCKQGTACLVGCGSQKTAFTRDVVLELLESYGAPLVVDADGINSVCGHIDRIKERAGVTVVTPHPGEMARFMGKSVEYVQANRLQVATEFARENGVVVVLKGAGTIVADPSGRTAVSLTGNSGLSKGGSGDILAGMITSFLAQGIPAFESAYISVWLHGRAGEMASATLSRRSMLPSDVMAALPALFLEMETE